jgi:hypothetical protein
VGYLREDDLGRFHLAELDLMMGDRAKQDEQRQNCAVEDAAGEKGCGVSFGLGKQTKTGLMGRVCLAHVLVLHALQYGFASVDAHFRLQFALSKAFIGMSSGLGAD